MNFNLKAINIIECFFVLIFSSVSVLVFSEWQPQIIAGGGFGWDGIQYAKIFSNFSSVKIDAVAFPFCNRVGTPFLAHMTSIEDVALAFKVVNSVFAVMFSIVVYAIARISGLNFYYSFFAVLLTIVPFFSPARFVPYYPVYTDPVFLVFLAVSFLFLIRNRYALSFLVLALAFPFREAAIYIAPIFLLFAIYLGGVSRFTVVGFLVAVLVMFLIRAQIQLYSGCEGAQLSTAIEWVQKRSTDPVLLVKYISAISMTAAPLFLINRNTTLTNVEKISMAGFFFAALLAFSGGSDSTRIFYSFLPIYILAIVGVIRSVGYWFSAISLLGYVLVNSFGSKILEPLNYSPNNDLSGLFWQFPDHGRPEVAICILFVWLLLFSFFRGFSPLWNNK